MPSLTTSGGKELFMPQPPFALVFGASGYIGSNLVTHLLKVGWQVRAAARNPAVLEARDWQGVEIVQADALQPETLLRSLCDVQVAFYLVHSMGAGAGFGRLDLQAADNFARAATEAGVARIVYLGGLVPAEEAGEHIDSRRETGEILRRAGTPVIEIRAGIIVGPGSAAFEVMRDLVLHLPVMITPRWVRSRSPPIALSNLLVYLERIALCEKAVGNIYEAAGSESCTYEEMMYQLAAATGKRAPFIIPVPVLTPELSAYWLGLTTAVPTNIARALIGGLKNDFTADDEALRRLVPQRLLGVREAIDAALESERAQAPVSRWTEGAFSIRAFDHDVAFYAKRASGSAITRASPSAAWQQITAIGGNNRYYYMNFLWSIREFMDWCIGGPGFSRIRRHPTDLRLGDTIDYWSVIGIEENRRLTLNFAMRAPGAGVLEFELEELDSNHTRIIATAYWHPRGVWGLAYWYVLIPIHLFIFKGMTAAIARRAEDSA
jgi:uncharacterized protein YbjT (DUF2867 family)